MTIKREIYSQFYTVKMTSPKAVWRFIWAAREEYSTYKEPNGCPYLMWSTTAATEQDRNFKIKKYSKLLFHQFLASSNILKYNGPFLPSMSWNHSQFGGDDSEKAAFNKLPVTHCGYTLREGTERVIKISFLINIDLIHIVQFNFSNELLVPWSSKPRTNNKEQEKVTEMTLSRGPGPKLTGRSTEDKRAFMLPLGERPCQPPTHRLHTIVCSPQRCADKIHKKTVLQRLFPFQIMTYTKKIASHVTDTLVTDPQSLTETCTFLSSAFLIKTLTSSQLNNSKPLPPGLAYHKAVYTPNTPTIYNRFSPFDMPERSMLPTSTQLGGGGNQLINSISLPLWAEY